MNLIVLLKSLPTNRAPGIDGLPVKFYSTFWDLLGPCLLIVFLESIKTGELPLSCRRAIISLIPKKGDLQLVENWRPISLLCVDDKILSKLLANRVKTLIGHIVSPDQSYCNPG